jgi:hypothetical protein
VHDIDLVIVERHELFALDKAALLIILPSDDIDLPIQQANSKVAPLTLHRLYVSEGFIGSAQVFVLDDESAGPASLPDDVVAAALLVVDRLRTALPVVLAMLLQAEFGVRDAVHGCDWLHCQLF